MSNDMKPNRLGWFTYLRFRVNMQEHIRIIRWIQMSTEINHKSVLELEEIQGKLDRLTSALENELTPEETKQEIREKITTLEYSRSAFNDIKGITQKAGEDSQKSLMHKIHPTLRRFVD